VGITRRAATSPSILQMKFHRYTAKIATKILERIAAGESLRNICKEPGMPSFRSVLSWAGENKDGFRDKYAFAMDIRAQWIHEEMLEIADNIEPGKRVKKNAKGTEVTIGDMVERSKLRVDTRKWILARMSPKRYGEKITQEISGPGGGPIQTEGDYRMTPEDEAFIKRAADSRAALERERSAQSQPTTE
jgi:hypothetical protein